MQAEEGPPVTLTKTDVDGDVVAEINEIDEKFRETGMVDEGPSDENALAVLVLTATDIVLVLM